MIFNFTLAADKLFISNPRTIRITSFTKYHTTDSKYREITSMPKRQRELIVLLIIFYISTSNTLLPTNNTLISRCYSSLATQRTFGSLQYWIVSKKIILNWGLFHGKVIFLYVRNRLTQKKNNRVMTNYIDRNYLQL